MRQGQPRPLGRHAWRQLALLHKHAAADRHQSRRHRHRHFEHASPRLVRAAHAREPQTRPAAEHAAAVRPGVREHVRDARREGVARPGPEVCARRRPAQFERHRDHQLPRFARRRGQVRVEVRGQREGELPALRGGDGDAVRQLQRRRVPHRPPPARRRRRRRATTSAPARWARWARVFAQHALRRDVEQAVGVLPGVDRRAVDRDAQDPALPAVQPQHLIARTAGGGGSSSTAPCGSRRRRSRHGGAATGPAASVCASRCRLCCCCRLRYHEHRAPGEELRLAEGKQPEGHLRDAADAPALAVGLHVEVHLDPERMPEQHRLAG